MEAEYEGYYLCIAAHLGPAANVLELGVQEGKSLQHWRKTFPEGRIVGVDVNPCPNTEGCTFIRLSQEAPGLPYALGGTFDLIIDDASHVGVHTFAAFANLWPLVNPGGFYVIEDWMIGLPEFKSHPMHDPAMLTTVQSLITLLRSPESECEEVTYRYGMCVARKRGQ